MKTSHRNRTRALFQEMEKLVELLGRQQKAWRTSRALEVEGEEETISRLEEMHKELEAKNAQ